jgi:hypothetical protein
MYIPLAYWNTQGDAYPTMVLSLFSPVLGIRDLKYTYEGIATTSSFSGGLDIQNYCADIYNASDLQNEINSITSLISRPLYFCSASPSASNLTSSQCCVTSPPNTGPEAWYFDVSYNALDKGTYYYNYINESGRIVNDTISFGQTKRIIAQSAPLVSRNSTDTFQYYINWTAAERYPGDVIPYPLKGVPTLYTLQLKRDSARNPGTYKFPDITLSALDFNSNTGVYSILNKGQLLEGAASSLNATAAYTADDIPIDNNDLANDLGNTVWIISASVLPKAAHRLTACNTTNSIWVTMDNYNVYQTGSVLKVTNAQLTATASCWSVSNLTSSLSTSVQLQNVNVSQSYSILDGGCAVCINPNAATLQATGGVTGSFVSGGFVYTYHLFESSSTLTILSGSTTETQIAVIAGGAGRGEQVSPAAAFGGGGGAGGAILQSGITLSSGSTFTIEVGNSGSIRNNGNNSFFSSSLVSIVATGGGYGSYFLDTSTFISAGTGGSGGGGNPIFGGAGSGISGQGNNGSNGTTGNYGGGGGKGSAASGRSGGNGVEWGSQLIGSSSYYAAGGNGASGAGDVIGQNNYGSGGGYQTSAAAKKGVVIVTYKKYI